MGIEHCKRCDYLEVEIARLLEQIGNVQRIMPEHKLMMQALQALGEQLLVPGNWHPTEAIACRGIVKAVRELKQERDEARAAAEYWRDQVANRRGNLLDWEVGTTHAGQHVDHDKWSPEFE